MKKKQPARNRARVASAKELERDAKEQLAYLDHYKPRPRKLTAEEQKEIAWLDYSKPRPPKPLALGVRFSRLDAAGKKSVEAAITRAEKQTAKRAATLGKARRKR